MSVITFDTAIESPATATDMPVTRPRVWRVGLVAGLGAAAATAATAVVADAAGVSLAISGEQIPPAGFAQLTFMCALLGVALAAVFARRSSRPRTTFVRTTVALTVLSLLPDVVVDADSATRLVLGLTHIVAAAIVIPAISRSLRD